MLLLSALLMPCTPFRIGPTRIERELAELEQAAERAGLDGVRLPFELDLVPAMFQHPLDRRALAGSIATRRGAGAPKEEIRSGERKVGGTQRANIRFWPSHNSCYEVVMLAVITTSVRCYECYCMRCFEVL